MTTLVTTRTRRRLGVGLATAALAGGALLTGAGPAAAYNPCWGDAPPPRCFPHVPPTPAPPPPTYDEVAAFTVGPVFYNGNDHNQWQQTTVSLVIVHDTATKSDLSAYVTASTRTRTDDAFAGFHASAWVTGGPGAYFETTQHRYGVDGTAIPFGAPSDRTDSWTEAVPLGVAEADRGGTLYTHSNFG